MMIIASLLVRNDDDILSDSMSFHLNNGVDAFIVTEHYANDNVRHILKQYDEYIIRRFVENDTVYNQSKWVTRMAVAASEYNPDWVIHCDADELWHNLNSLENIDNELCLTECWRNYLPYSISKFSIDEALKYEQPVTSSIFGLGMQNKKKIIHKPNKNIKILQGNHGVECNIEPYQSNVIIHHYPVRTYEQFKLKSIIGGEVYNGYCNKHHGTQWRRWHDDYLNGKLMETYMSFLGEDSIFI